MNYSSKEQEEVGAGKCGAPFQTFEKSKPAVRRGRKAMGPPLDCQAAGAEITRRIK
jgi:hypothetical protein